MAAGSRGSVGATSFDPMSIMMGSKQGLPYDIQEKQAELARKKKLVDAYLAASQGQESPTIDAGTYKVANWSGPLSKVINAFMANKLGKEFDSKNQEVAQEYNKRLGEGTEKYLRTRQGTADTDVPPSPDETGAQVGPPAMIPGEKANPLRAIAEAMSSGLPGLHDMAKADMVNLQKGQIFPKDILGAANNFSRDSVVKAIVANDPSLLKPPSEFHAVGDTGVTTTNGQVTGKEAVNTYAAPSINPTVGVPTQQNIQTGKEVGITGGNVTPVTHFSNKLADAQIAQLEAGRKQYLDSQSQLRSVGQVLTDIEPMDPAKFGTGAEFRNNVLKAGALLGMKPGQETQLMQNVHSGLGNLMIEKVRALAPVTEQDVKMMQDIIGSESNTKVALQKILNVAEKKLAGGMDTHRKFVAGFEGQGGVDDFEKFRQQWSPDMQFTTVPPGGGQPQSNYQRDPNAPDPLGLFK